MRTKIKRTLDRCSALRGLSLEYSSGKGLKNILQAIEKLSLTRWRERTRWLVSEINHGHDRVTDNSVKRKERERERQRKVPEICMSRSLRRDWSPVEGRTAEGLTWEGTMISALIGEKGGTRRSNKRHPEKFQFYGRLKNRRWRFVGVKNYRRVPPLIVLYPLDPFWSRISANRHGSFYQRVFACTLPCYHASNLR